ncbi:MAG: hypothetical protein WDZ90_01630 [Candidatus Paceibacterota bacterium]
MGDVVDFEGKVTPLRSPTLQSAGEIMAHIVRYALSQTKSKEDFQSLLATFVNRQFGISHYHALRVKWNNGTPIVSATLFHNGKWEEVEYNTAQD